MNNPRPSLFGKGSQVFEAAVRETLTGRLISKSLLNPCFSLQSSMLEFSPDGVGAVHGLAVVAQRLLREPFRISGRFSLHGRRRKQE